MRKYQLVVRFEIDAMDDAEAREIASELREAGLRGSQLPDQFTEKLQEIRDGSPPRPIPL